MNSFCDAFISYGRADSLVFGRKLYARLLEEGFKVWFDQNDIPLGVDFQNQIDDGIEKAHNFLFIIAPHSVNSPYCLKEIELAIKRNKRIIPLLHVEQINQEIWQQRFPNGTAEEWEAYKAKGKHTVFQNMHPTIGKINWVYFREEIDDFEKSFAGLIDLFRRHQDYVEKHTHFLAKALEWERHQKRTSYLLIGEEKQQAQTWLKRRFKDEQPPCIPTDLHCEYITESIKNANNLMNQVFLSYADVDRVMMEKIRNSLRRESITVWTNKTDIQMGEAFEEAIERGIEQADNVVYLLSPDSIISEFCQRELDYALSLNKRIIPVWVRETESMLMPPALRHLQYIDLTDNVRDEDYLLDESQLLKILYEDAAYYDEHKILLTKALKWKRQHENPSILLRGYNLRSAQAWLKVAQKRIQHPPIPLQEEFIAESLRQPPLESLDVFISYSRADSDFARKLNDTLQIQGKTTWFDQESIASGSDFQQEIYRGIKACDNFLFVLSPRSVNSPYCADEVEYAAQLNKRFVTVLHRDVKSQELHPGLAKVQWIDFNHHERDFNANFNQLVRTLDTDREHVHNHTKWLQRALEWQQKGKSDDLLLRGSEFAIAQNWLKEAEQQKKQPAATPLQQDYITASREVIAAGIKREKLRLIILRSLLALVSIVAVVAFLQWLRAEKVKEAQINSTSRFSLALSDTDQKLDALIEAIRAGRRLQEKLILSRVSPETRSLVLTALQAAVYKSGFRERNRLTGHEYSVNSANFSPDGQIIATASGDHTVKLWSSEGQLLHTLKGHKGWITSVSFSPDGQIIATASGDTTVKLWSSEGQLLHTLKGHTKDVHSVSFSLDGKMIATASEDKTVILWSSEGQLLQTIAHQDGVSSVSFSPDGKAIASAIYKPPIITLWNRKGKKLQVLRGHGDAIQSIVFSPDGKTIASASDDRTVILWNRDKGTRQLTLKGHGDQVKSVVFSPNGKTIASASRDKTVILWNRDKGFRELTLKGHRFEVGSVSFSPDGKTIASASRDKTVILWNREGKELQSLKGHNDLVKSVAWSPDGKIIASASWDGAVKLWSREGQLINILPHIDLVHSVSFSPDGQIIATARKGKTVTLWSREGKLLNAIVHQDGLNSVSFSPDGQTIAVASQGGTVILCSREGKKLHILTGHNGEVYSVAWSPDSKTIASGSQDGTVKLWSREGQLLQTLKGHTQDVFSVSFSPDGQRLASGSKDGTVKLWSREGQLLHTLIGHDDQVQSVAWSRDGNMIASASLDRTVKLWSREGQPLQTLKGHNGEVYSVAWSPDSKTIASASQDKTVILWNLKDLQLDRLMEDACDWVRDYLKNNSKVEESDRTLCDGIGKQ